MPLRMSSRHCPYINLSTYYSAQSLSETRQSSCATARGAPPIKFGVGGTHMLAGGGGGGLYPGRWAGSPRHHQGYPPSGQDLGQDFGRDQWQDYRYPQTGPRTGPVTGLWGIPLFDNRQIPVKNIIFPILRMRPVIYTICAGLGGGGDIPFHLF